MKSEDTKLRTTQELVLLSIFLIPFYFFRFNLLGIKTNIFEVITFITFVVFLINHVNSLTIKKFNFSSVWIYLFLLSALIGTLLSADKVHAFGILKGWFFFPIVLFLLVLNTFNKTNASKLAIPIYLSSILVSAWAILQKAGIIGLLFYQKQDPLSFNGYFSQGRAFGPFESPNYLAMFLVPVFFLSLPIFKEVKNKGLEIIIALSFLLPLVAIYFSTSRGGAVAGATGALALILFLYFRSRVFRKKFEGMSNILIFGLILVAALFLIYVVRIVSPNEGGDSVRLEIYNYSIALIKSHPFFGIGLGEFQNAIAEVSKGNGSFQEYGLSYALHPHNLYLAMWLNLGLAGLVTFLGVLWIGFKNLFSKKDNIFIKSCLFAGLVAILVHGLFDTTYFKNDLSAIFWIILATSFIYKE